ncbi:MerR family transcriptional regulator [Nocardiopsis mangrovi]|uniref:MerR family transcriptional regulator n=1 Tax=Nocardiopsis mangrovi TaxID=1179818 RepID=A0ABV9E5R6_9ACTN
MAWSTREIAELAGTSLRAVRHYHEVGLLDEPERRANGYKQYGVAHLVRVLRIRRLAGLGFSLPEIAAMGEAEDHPETALRTREADLTATIERLQWVRRELGLILREAEPTDPPPSPPAPEARLSDADRSVIVTLSRGPDPKGLRAYADMLRDVPPDPVAAEFDRLPADADEQIRQDLAERMAPYVRALDIGRPGARESADDASGGALAGRSTVGTDLGDLYNPAQLDVIDRMGPLLQGSLRADHL